MIYVYMVLGCLTISTVVLFFLAYKQQHQIDRLGHKLNRVDMDEHRNDERIDKILSKMHNRF